MPEMLDGWKVPLRKLWMGDADDTVPDSYVWLMGRRYGPFRDAELADRYGEFQRFHRDFHSRLWFTYRSGFEPIRPTRFTTDAGWGCMLRSGQMVLGETLLRHVLTPEWQLGHNMRDVVRLYSEILTWFLDQTPSPFSLHQIATEGVRFDKNIGEWFGPSTIAAVLRDLVQRHRPFGLTAYVAQDGMVFRDKALETARTPPPSSATLAKPVPVVSLRPLSPSASASTSASPSVASESSGSTSADDAPPASSSDAEPFYGVLILIPLRLGLDYMNEIYEPALRKCFEFPQSVGIAGGRPNSSLYFVAVDDSLLYFLDPHITRPAMQDIKPLGQYTEEDWRTYHCPDVRRIDMARIDPSLMLAFYCRTRADLDDFFRRADETAVEGPSIFSVADEAPRYFQDDEVDLAGADEGGSGSDDDDFDLM